jgi:UDP-N-acetylglucosamine--dolichyl-phosphate N-acetylglucosaminephosphotransferase
VIIGNFEIAGAILLIPYIIDFLIKAKNHFPYSFGVYREGKLYCPEGGPVGLGQLIMKVCGGISERNLVLVLIGIETIFGVVAILLYV